MNAEIDIDKLLNEGERINLECKKALNAVPNSLWESYSSFANTNGGNILLGVEENVGESEKSKRFIITGVENAEKIRKDLWNILNNKEKINANLLTDNDIQVVNHNGKNVIVISVPRAVYSQRPIYINNNIVKGTYKRNHEGDYHCSEQMIRMMIRDTFEEGNDRMCLEHYNMDDIDIPTLEGYRVMFKINNPEHIWNSFDNKDFLLHLGGYFINRQDNTEGLTIAGLLMFGKGLQIRERFDNLRMDYIDKSNLIGDQRYSDRLTYDGTWENNLFNFIRMVIPRLTRDLPRPFQMDGIIRTDDTPQHKAVREAFTNMIIHSDLMLNGLLRVEKYDDRLVLTNPGLLKLPLEQIYIGGESKARNQRMQNMLRMIGYGENLGSGFPLIINAWNEKHWLKPELIEQSELMQVKLILHIANAGGKKEFDPKNGPKNDPKKLTERQRDILELLTEDGSLTRTTLAQRLRTSDSSIKRDIGVLKKLDFIFRDGGKTFGKWVVKKQWTE